MNRQPATVGARFVHVSGAAFRVTSLRPLTLVEYGGDYPTCRRPTPQTFARDYTRIGW